MIDSAQDFYRLRTSKDPSEYERAACEGASIAVWSEVIATMPDMREWVALNKTVPTEILAVLARDQSERVRSVVAMKRKLPETLQLELAVDPNASVRERLGYNAKATKKVLEILAKDAEGFVRERPAQRLKTGDFVL